MKRHILLSFFLLTAFSAFAQNLRDSVCIVREEFTDETKNWLKETADYLNKNGYKKYGEVLKNLDGSTFGSGFVYIAPDGKSYIVTNRHVVPSREMAVIQFEQPDGTYKEFKDLKVVSLNTDFDLALIELPAGASNTGLRLATIPVTEGEEIWTAGFPGLVGKPSWQLGKGNITNATTRIPDLIDPAVSTLIQHSAPTDPGNSGGPLLRKRTGGTYEVVGINTWKVNSRQTTNLSMPVSLVRKFLAEKNEIQQKVSNEYLRENGAADFIKILRTGSTDDRNKTLEVFSESPIDGLLEACRIQIEEKEENSSGSEEETKSKSSAKKKKSSQSVRMDIDNPYTVGITASLLNTPSGPGFGGRICIQPGLFFGSFLECGVAKYKGTSYAMAGVNARLLIPIMLNDFYIAPYGFAGFNLEFSEVSGFGLSAGGGIEGGRKFDMITLFGFCEFNYKTATLNHERDSENKSRPFISLGAGIAF